VLMTLLGVAVQRTMKDPSRTMDRS